MRMKWRLSFHWAFLVVLCFLPQILFSQGSLVPPGAPGQTFKTLSQIEPRVDLLTIPGNLYSQYYITNPGSYYLTSGIKGTAGKDAIRIEADNVSLDLNGFALDGSGTGGWNAIFVTTAHTNILIRNGTLRNWQYGGISAYDSNSMLIENVRAISNGVSSVSDGIFVGPNSEVAGCQASANSGRGIGAAMNSLVSRCAVFGNGHDGIAIGNNARVKDSVSLSNAQQGIQMQSACGASGCVSTGNGGAGFSGNESCTYSLCSANGNGGIGGDSGFKSGAASVFDHCTAQTNNYSGIKTYGPSSISACSVQGNGTNGIWAAAGSSVIGCVTSFNAGHGIWAENACLVNGCNASSNTYAGLMLFPQCTARDCTAWGNAGDGIDSGDGCLLETCNAQLNYIGFYCGSACRVHGCNASQNGSIGIRVLDHSTISDCLSSSNLDDGLRAGNDSVLKNNASIGNGSFGAQVDGIYLLGSRNHLEGNTLKNNAAYGMRITTSSNVIIRNSASSNGAAPNFIGGGNDSAPWSSAATATSPLANTQ